MSFHRLLVIVLAALVAGLVAWGFVPDPVKVETATAGRGPLTVTVDEDAETRAVDRYVVAAPTAGRLARIDLRDGDSVRAGQVVARMWPLPLSAREREEQQARVAAAESRVRETEEQARRAATALDQARRDRVRAERLVKEGFLSPQAAEEARMAEAAGASEMQAAGFRVQSAEADLKAARVSLFTEGAGNVAALVLRAPVDGRILRVLERSERVVAAGTPLVVLGDAGRLEVVIDLLSTDAVKVRPGMPVLLEGWGGTPALRAKVSTVEPQAFTKVSALGVEEQRVNAVAELVDPPGALGDSYRVEARIVLWSAGDVIKVPVSALFRSGEKWNVFVVEGGRARRREVQVGQRNASEAQVTEGLKEGEMVVRHLSNELADGARVKS